MKTGPSGQSGRTVSARSIAILLSLMLGSSSIASAADQTADRGTLHVTVLEDTAKTPIPRADVRLTSDDRLYDGRSRSDGNVDFARIVPDQYLIKVTAAGYRFTRQDVISIRAGETQSLTVLGTRTSFRKIGSVRTVATPAPNVARSLDTQDSSAQIAGSLGAALGSITSIGRDSTLTINNQGTGQTTATINGAPIFPSGSPIGLALFSGDIFSNATVNSGGTAGAPGGSLDFKTYDPTIDWSGLLQQRGASFGSLGSSDQIRGTVGHFGVAVTHAQTGSTQPFDGDSFRDTSGRFYTHQTATQNTSDIATLRYGFDPNHVGLLDYGRLESDSPNVCTFQSGPLPCGFGPGNRTLTTRTFAQYRDQLQLDRARVSFNLFTSRLSSVYDESGEQIAGISIGAFGTSIIDRVGFKLSTSTPISARRSATLQLQSTTDAANFGGATTLRQPVPPTRSTIQSGSIKLPLIGTSRFAFSFEGGANGGYGTTRPTIGAGSSYTLTRRDTLRVDYSNGQIPSKAFTFAGTALPETVQPECATGRAIIGGPSSAGDVGSTAKIAGSLHHQGNGFVFDADAYRTSAANATETAAIPGTSLGAISPTPLFYARASQIASLECGRPFALDSLSTYFTTTASVQQQLTDGIDLGLNVELLPRASVKASYSLSRARAFGASLLFTPGSNLIAGDQIPGRPIAQSQLSGRYALSRTTTLLGEVVGVSGNNPYGQAPIVQYNLGLRTRAASSDIVASVQNIGNAHGTAFTGFGPFPVLAQPLAPRRYALNIRLALGRQNIDRTENLSPGFDANNSFEYEPLEFESRPAEGWLAPRTDVPSCGPEKIAATKAYEAAVTSYVADVTAQIAAGKDPSTIASANYQALAMRVVSAARTPTLELTFDLKKIRSWAPFFACSRIHGDTLDKAVARGVYSPGWRERESHGYSTVYYSEIVGIYYAPELLDDDPVVRSFNPPAFSKKRGDARFAIVEAACPMRQRDAMNESVKGLHAYIDAYYAGRRPSNPEGFTIVGHVAKSEMWLEIKPDDVDYRETINNCLDIPFVTPDQLREQGLGGAGFPSINFAPGVGFYNTTIEMSKP